MFSTIDRKIANECMWFKHLGTAKDGKEQPEDEASKNWRGARENYTLKEIDEVTELSVAIDVTENEEQYFRDIFPKALEKVKSLSES